MFHTNPLGLRVMDVSLFHKRKSVICTPHDACVRMMARKPRHGAAKSCVLGLSSVPATADVWRFEVDLGSATRDEE